MLVISNRPRASRSSDFEITRAVTPWIVLHSVQLLLLIKVEVRVISRDRRLRLITLTETLIILDITKTESHNCFIIHWTRKLGSHVSASSLTASNTDREKLTWLPLEIMHCGHTWHVYPWRWHDYPWPWHDYCIICSYEVMGADFENSLYAFGQSEKTCCSRQSLLFEDYFTKALIQHYKSLVEFY